MKQFDIQKFREVMSEFCALKTANTPYDRETWKTNSSEEDGPARKCIAILESVKGFLADVSAEWGMDGAKIHVSKGAGYFPKVPWIGILFKNEKPTDGVYPALGFYEDGFIVSCTASFARPQSQFLKRCYTKEEIKLLKADNGESISEYVNIRTAKDSITWFAYRDDAKLTEDRIKEALRKAIDVYHGYRGNCTDKKAAWFTQKTVNDVGEWLEEIEKEQKSGTWVFRGQGDSAWGLETGLGRKCFSDEDGNPELDLENVLDAERGMMDEFRREIARRVEYKSFRDIEQLALMQHYESKTRLLDFSFSPIVALYFALESYDDYMGHVRVFRKLHGTGECNSDEAKVDAISVWAVNVEQISCPTKSEVDEMRKASGAGKLRRENSGKSLRERLELFHEEADAILNVAASEVVKEGVDVVVPSVNNDRSSAQEGLFLMPRRMDRSFEANLAMSIEGGQKSEGVSCCIRHDFPVAMIDEIRGYLKSHRMTAKQIFPDLTGLAKSLNAKMDVGGKRERRS